MRTEESRFFSDGLGLGASFHWADGAEGGAPAPLVIACSGFTGLRHIHPARFARFLTGRGRACLGFDYRGFADSEGPRRRVLLEEQVRDVIHAAGFAAGDGRVDAGRIVLLGWGMGGGLVLDAARGLPGVCGIVAVNGFYNGERVQRAHRGEEGLREFRARVEEERRARCRTGVAAEADPFDIYPLDAGSREYVDTVLRRTPGYEAEGYSFELAESLLRWDPEAFAGGMRVPLLIAHGERNELHPPGEAESLLGAYAGPASLYWIEGAGHTEFMHDEDARFLKLAAHVAEWIDALVAEPGGA